MSSELDDVARSLFIGQIPNIWRKLAPDTLKSLGNWILYFLQRFSQYTSWVREQWPAHGAARGRLRPLPAFPTPAAPATCVSSWPGAPETVSASPSASVSLFLLLFWFEAVGVGPLQLSALLRESALETSIRVPPGPARSFWGSPLCRRPGPFALVDTEAATVGFSSSFSCQHQRQPGHAPWART